MVPLLLCAQIAAGQYARPYSTAPASKDPIIEKIDNLAAQVEALVAEDEARNKQADQDSQNLMRELPRTSSIDDLFSLMRRYPLHDFGEDIQDHITTRFITLNEQRLSSLDSKTAEYFVAMKRNEARLAEEQAVAADNVRKYFAEGERSLAKRRMLLDHWAEWENLGKERINAQREALDNQRQVASEMQRPRQEKRRSGYGGFIDPHGRVIDADGNYAGTRTSDGRFINSDGSFGGFVDPAGRVIDANGNYRGTQLPDGRFINSDGSFGGFVDPAGRIIFSD